jgi:MFS superfamily sulfate permease-like transporter
MRRVDLRFFTCFVAGIILGIIVGCTVLSALVSFRVDSYYQKIKALENDVYENQVKCDKLKETIDSTNKKNKYILRDVEIYFKYDKIQEDEIDKLTLEKGIREKYKDYLGKEVKNIDIDVVSVIVDKDIILLEDKKYQLKVVRILLSDILKIWITVSEA